MMKPSRAFAILLCVSFAIAALASAQDDDDDKPATQVASPAADAAQPALDAEQQAAVGIVVAHPLAAHPAREISAYGQVLDPATLVADAGQLEAARATERTANADVARLQALYRGDAGASLKVLQAAQSEQVSARARSDAATAAFASRWGSLLRMPAAQRQALIDAVSSGKRLLVRADLLGRRSLGVLPTSARLDVDGITVPASVIGTSSQVGADVQGAGVILEVGAVPIGFGPGARVAVVLAGESQPGVLLPASALIYAEEGTHVYRQLAAKTTDGKVKYAATNVKLLQAQGDAWLVEGVDDDDLVVVHGAGVLWSLQGLGATSADDDD